MSEMNFNSKRAFPITEVAIFGLLILLNISSVHGKVNKTSKALNIVTILEPPFVMKDPKTGVYTGMMIDILHEAGITIDHIDTPMHHTYGWEEEPGTFNGAIGDLANGKYDLAVAPFSIRSQRAKAVIFTQPVMYSGFLLLYKTPSDMMWKIQTDKLATLLKPFSPAVWSLLFLMCLLATAAFYVIRRFNPYEQGDTDGQRSDTALATMSWGRSLMFLIGSLTGRNYSLMPSSTSGRILTGFWWLFSMMTVGAYVASLVVILFKSNPKKGSLPFMSIDDVVGSDVKVLGIKESTTYKYMAGHNGHFERLIYDHWQENWDGVMVDSMTEALRLLEEGNGKYAIFMDESLATYLASQEPCDKMIIGEPVGDDTLAFACRKGSTVCDDLNQFILDMQETGKMELLRDKWFWGGCHLTTRTFATDNNYNYLDKFDGKEPGLLSPNSITISRFSGAFLVLLVGFLLATIVLIAEVVYVRRKGNVHYRLKVFARHDDAQVLHDQDSVART